MYQYDTLVWDVTSGLVVGIILCAFATIWLAKALRIGPVATVPEYAPYFFGSIFAGSIGITMFVWSLVHLPEAWLLLAW